MNIPVVGFQSRFDHLKKFFIRTVRKDLLKDMLPGFPKGIGVAWIYQHL